LSIMMKDVLAYPEKPWNWRWISSNSGITMRDVLAHPGKPWNWELISGKPDIVMGDILSYPEKPWDWNELSQNEFLFDPEMQSRAIKKLITFREQYRKKMMFTNLQQSSLYSDIINLIMIYAG
jgi:hypothetical protein